jgi:AbrB family transcriptional regulator, transcriptional pleiotropic regulator of transition state genes
MEGPGNRENKRKGSASLKQHRPAFDRARNAAAMGRTSRATRGVTTTGIIRHIDELGRIVIPIEIRKRFGLSEKDPLEISVKRETILLSKPRTACVFCGSSSSVEEHRGRAVCRICIAELAKAYS